MEQNNFQIKDCPYFPCHNIENTNTFNCKHCFCPLYYSSCKGNYIINEMGVKDCTNCNIPHMNNQGHQWIMLQINLKLEI